MTLDEAIAVSRETAKVYSRLGMAEIASQHMQVTEWLMRSRDSEDSDEWLEKRIDELEDEVAEQSDDIEALVWDRDVCRRSAQQAQDENAKLRELVVLLWDTALHPNTLGDGSYLMYRMRELGVEVGE